MTPQINEDSSEESRAGLLRVADVARMLSVSTRTVWRMRDAGELPCPVRLGSGNMIRWRRSDIEGFIRSGLCAA